MLKCVKNNKIYWPNYKRGNTKLDIPIYEINGLEINKISTSITYLNNGKYEEVVGCSLLWLELINK